MTEQTIYLEDRVLGAFERLQMLQDAVAAVLLLGAAWTRLQSALPLVRVLGAVEGVAGAVLAVFLVRSLRAGTDDNGRRDGLLNLMSGGLLLLESGAAFAEGQKLLRPALAAALTSLALGTFRLRVAGSRARRRWVRLGPEGIAVQFSPLRRVQMARGEVVAVRRAGAHLHIESRGGRVRTLHLRRYRNAAEIGDALLGWARDHGVPASTAPGG